MSVHPRVDGKMRTAESEGDAASPPSVILFGRQHTLALRSDAETGQLRLGAADGRELVLIEVGSQGLSMRASGLTLSWDERGGSLRLEVDRLTLVGREHVAIETEGNLELRAGGHMSFTAPDQAITATVGDVQIIANDDVALSGEKILLNR
jgi:hypothetical protein